MASNVLYYVYGRSVAFLLGSTSILTDDDAETDENCNF